MARTTPHALSIAVAMATLALAAAGCGGTKLLKEPEPMPALPPIATAGDGRVEARIEALIVRNGPGSWAKDASWDEYLLAIRNASDTRITLTGFSVHDSLGTELVSRDDRSELVDASVETERRYKDRGLSVEAGSGSPWLVAAGVTAGTLAWAAGMGSAAAAGGSMVGAVAAGTVVVGTLAFGGIALAVYGVNRALNNREVAQEIRRRHALAPAVLEGGANARLHVFFPYAPSPSRVVVVYRQGEAEHRLGIDTAAPLAGLHLGVTPPAAEPPVSRVARTDRQSLSLVAIEGQRPLRYLHREPASAAPREVVLVSSAGGMQSFSDGSRYRDLREMAAFGALDFEPPVPFAIEGMKVGTRWSHSGRAVERAVVTQGTIVCEFRVEAQEEHDTPAGRFATWRVSEHRSIQDASYRLTHWIDVQTLGLVASRGSTERVQPPRTMGHGVFSAPRYDYALEVAGR